MQQIEWEDFQRVELRVGTLLSADASALCDAPGDYVRVP